MHIFLIMIYILKTNITNQNCCPMFINRFICFDFIIFTNFIGEIFSPSIHTYRRCDTCESNII